ncbi:calmin [Carlito syrichta]|uniref:Calmin n=1 Tax=Carlito syrichta TaxID=1868482 RepID=A0A1U7TB18_CARSF|nr:calmin [Carlito syrichta]
MSVKENLSVLASLGGCRSRWRLRRDSAISPQELEARVPEGQRLFETLLRLGPAWGASEELEDLRYRWMLYKSKLKDGSHLLVGGVPSKRWAQVERETVQKRTFTRWINLHLDKCNPPLEVKDLFVDIQDGKILMALLEVLSGRNLLHEYKSSSHRIFRLNNIAKALQFLEDSNVKLVSIDAAEIADGNPSLVLGLIWNIILFFQIKELTGNLSRNSPSSSLSPGSGGTDSDSSFPPTPTAERSAALSGKDQRRAIKALLAWVQRKTRKYGVAVQDFTGSWRSGLAFLAVIKAIDPSLVDMKQALEDSARENLEKAFSIAQEGLHIPRLLEPEDIMVDTPDEQSIVTYVAQFLEHFPELEAEDVLDSDKDIPIESTFVRIKETPSEQESKVFVLTENGERAYTVNHETSQPPPSKVFVCDKPENLHEFCLGGVSHQAGSTGSSEDMDQAAHPVLQGDPSKTSGVSELSSESSILSSRKDSRRSNSLPVKKMVHFETDAFKDTSRSQDPSHGQDFHFEGRPRAPKDSQKLEGLGLAVEVAEKAALEEASSGLPDATSGEAPDDGVSWAEGVIPDTQPSPSSEAAAGHGEEGPRSPPGENAIMAESWEIQVKLQTVDAMDEEDFFEGIPLKASKFNSDLVDFASTSQAFDEDPSPREETPTAPQAPEDPAERRGKRRAKTAHRERGPPEPRVDADGLEPREGPGRGTPDSSSAPEATPLGGEPERCEKAKGKSARPGDEDKEEAPGPQEQEAGGDVPSGPPSGSVSLETLGSPSDESLSFQPSPPLSKVSVIPHDLFYYPHFEVPLATVLEAYAEGLGDLKDEEVEGEEPAGAAWERDSREEAEAAQRGLPFSRLDEGLSGASDWVPDPDRAVEDAALASGPAAPAPDQDHRPRETQESDPSESHSSREPPNAASTAGPLDAKAAAEPVSSKRKEKRRHVGRVESSLSVAPGPAQASDDLEYAASDARIPSRASHSDSSIYVRQHANSSLESDHFSYVPWRSAAELDDRGNRTLTRKAKKLGAAASPGHCPQSSSLTQLVQQPDTLYFILFLWLLVYCLLLFPQLDVARL